MKTIDFGARDRFFSPTNSFDKNAINFEFIDEKDEYNDQDPKTPIRDFKKFLTKGHHKQFSTKNPSLNNSFAVPKLNSHRPKPKSPPKLSSAARAHRTIYMQKLFDQEKALSAKNSTLLSAPSKKSFDSTLKSFSSASKSGYSNAEMKYKQYLKDKKIIEKGTLQQVSKKNSPEKRESDLLSNKEEIDTLLCFYQEQARKQNTVLALNKSYEKNRKAMRIKSPPKNVFDRLTAKTTKTVKK